MLGSRDELLKHVAAEMARAGSMVVGKIRRGYGYRGERLLPSKSGRWSRRAWR
jgi:hypothetical protein